MKKIFQYIIFETVRHQFKKKEKNPSSKQFEIEIQNIKVEFTHILRDSFLIMAGVLSASFGLKGFLLPNYGNHNARRHILQDLSWPPQWQ